MALSDSQRASISRQLEAAKSKALSLQKDVQAFGAAKSAGMTIDPKKTDVSAARAYVAAQPSANVPVSTLENPTSALTIPQNPGFNAQSVVNSSGALAVGNDYLKQLQDQVNSLGQSRTSAENRIVELFNMKAGEGARKQQLYDEAGIADKRTALNQTIANVSRKTALIAANDDKAFMDQVALEGQGQDSRLVGRNQNAIARERAIQRTAQAAELRAQVAVGELQQGNLKSATENIDAALEMEFQPVKDQLQAEMFFLGRLDNRVSESQKALVDERTRILTDNQNQLMMAQQLVSNAVASGAASPADIDAMFSMRDNPEQMAQYASKIIGKAAGRVTVDPMRALNIRAKLIELASLGDPQAIAQLGYDPRTTNTDPADVEAFEMHSSENTDLMNTIDRVLSDKNSQALNASVGTGFGKFVAGITPTLKESFLGPFSGLAARQRVNVEKQDLLNDIKHLVNNQGFKSLIELKGQGVTFGSLTTDERLASYSSGVALANALKIDPQTQEIVGLTGSAEALKRDLETIKTNLMKAQDNLNKKMGGFSPEDLQFMSQTSQ